MFVIHCVNAGDWVTRRLAMPTIRTYVLTYGMLQMQTTCLLTYLVSKESARVVGLADNDIKVAASCCRVKNIVIITGAMLP